MAWILITVSTASACLAIFWALKIRTRLRRIKELYAPIHDIEQHVSNERMRVENYVHEETQKIKAYVDTEKNKIDEYVNKENERYEEQIALKEEKIANLETEIKDLTIEYNETGKELLNVGKKLALAQNTSLLIDFGYYEPEYNFETSGEWDKKLEAINNDIKRMLSFVKHADNNRYKGEAAGYIIEVIHMNESRSQGVKMQMATIKLLLRAFNGECDSFIARVNYKNITTLQKRIDASYTAINKIGKSSNMVSISDKYRDLKQYELAIVHEYQEWKQREREEQARIREQIREEERASKELEKAKKEAEKEARRNAEALSKARAEVEGANEKQKEKLLNQIQELEKRMQEMEEKSRYISQAMLTKSGHVYIISNVGSFGEDMLKIGMTRRLEPMDRVKELGDASVPFPFDVHAMIRTSDAPSLENALHKHFEERRVNLENSRKEFFYVSLAEIQEELEILKDELNIEADIHITMSAEAKQWRISEAKRKHLEKSYNSPS